MGYDADPALQSDGSYLCLYCRLRWGKTTYFNEHARGRCPEAPRGPHGGQQEGASSSGHNDQPPAGLPPLTQPALSRKRLRELAQQLAHQLAGGSSGSSDQLGSPSRGSAEHLGNAPAENAPEPSGLTCMRHSDRMLVNAQSCNKDAKS